jgi:hypothetical protein
VGRLRLRARLRLGFPKISPLVGFGMSGKLELLT